MIQFKIANDKITHVDSQVWIVLSGKLIATETGFPAKGHRPEKVQITTVDREYISVKSVDNTNKNDNGFKMSPQDVFDTEHEALDRIIQLYRNHLYEYKKAEAEVQKEITRLLGIVNPITYVGIDDVTEEQPVQAERAPMG